MNICIISGSARPERKSHQVAQEVQRRLGTLNVVNWLWDVKETDLPLLDHTFDSHPDPSETLKRLKAKLDQTDGFIIVSPEHNGNYSGVLKNSMDYFYKEYVDKYFGMITVSTGNGVNALKGLQHYALRLNGIVCPQFLLTPQVQKLFTDQKLSDENYSERLDGFLAAFVSFSRFTNNYTMDYMEAQLINNGQTGDFELIIEGYRSFINYKIKEDRALLLHTEVPEELGKGAAALLVTRTFEYLEERGLKAVPVCTYIQHFLKRRPQWQHLVVEIQ